MNKPNKRRFDMNRLLTLAFTVILIIGFAALSMAGMKGKPQGEQIKVAQSAAPAPLSKDATIMVIGEDGKLVEAKKGTNGFTCVPEIEAQEEPDPICVDSAGWQWLSDAISGKPKPTNTVPGIAYMAKGGWHWEKDGKITPATKNEPGAKKGKEPAHWMVLGPFDSKMSGLPSMHHTKFGTYVMYDGTPYSHLMIYQDPNQVK